MALLAVRDDGEILAANADAKALLARPAEALIGDTLANRCSTSHAQAIATYLHAAFHDDVEQRWQTHVWTARDDEPVRMRLTARAMAGLGGERVLLVALEDITQVDRLEAEIHYQADHDALTGLLNRRGLEHALSQRTGIKAGAFVFHLNVDHFRYINELVGQHAADDVLCTIAAELREEVADDGLLARIGADEFVIVRSVDSREAAYTFAHGLIELLDGIALPSLAEQISLSGCVGMTRVGRGGPSSALTAASAACYQAKSATRGSVREYSARHVNVASARRVMTAVQFVRRALAEEAVALFAQPIYLTNATTGAPHAIEILARFTGRDGNAFPRDLLASAERFGLMDTFDRYVVRRTLDWLQQRPEVVDRTDHVAINLSGNSVSDPNFTRFLRDVVTGTSIPPGKLCFEITETAAVRDIDQARDLMATIGGLGCRFSLDDFGAGMCSFQYLRDLPADHVKIDGSFVQGMASDPVRRQIVRAINETAQILGKRTVAEFVDTPEVLSLLQELGVHMVQGWLFNPAMPLDEVESLLCAA